MRMTEQMTLRLDGKLAIITGAAGLIGSALAAGFAANGATVVLVDVDDARLQQVRDEIGGSAVALACDLTDTPAVNRLVDTVIDRFGVIDVLVNNAGGNHRMLPHLVTPEHWDRLLALNLTAPFMLSHAVGRHMIARGHGAIVNVTSTCGCSGMGRGNFVFSIAKAGLNAMTRELALEWGASGIRVNAIAPSQVDSPGMREWMAEPTAGGRTMGEQLLAGVPLGRLTTAQDIVGPALFLASDAAAMVSGLVLPVDGGNLTANAVGTPGAPIAAAELAGTAARIG
jgi:NAD(P)-dependent dehydrogenase (short-subunit alcohol dehydrogenase family)